MHINVIKDASLISYDEYKKQSKDLACKGYKTIVENGKTYIDISDSKDCGGFYVVGPHTAMFCDFS